MIRQALCLGVSTFDPGPDGTSLGELPFAAARAEAVAGALAGFGYTVTVETDRARLTAEALPTLIDEAAARTGPDGLLLVHLVSHGVRGETGGLYVLGSDGRRLPGTLADGWVRQVTEFPERYPRALFLLDVCHAGAAAREPWQVAALPHTRGWVIAACAPGLRAFNGRFSQAVANWLGTVRSGDAHVDVGQAVLPLDVVGRGIRREVHRLVQAEDGMPQEVVGSLQDIVTDPVEVPFFTNPRFVAAAGRRSARPVEPGFAPFLDDVDEALDPRHFMARAQGRIDARGEGPGCFSGRRAELRTLSAWCDGNDPAQLQVVTGSPGVGKSALIGVLVCAAHPDLHEPTRRLWKDIAWFPAVNPRLAAVHARQRGLAAITASLARQLKLDAGTTGELLDRIAALDGTVPLIVVDALDEAEGHVEVMRELLLPLARLTRAAGSPACRLLVGMRPWEDLADLRDLAGVRGGVIDLDDADPRQLAVDLEVYVQALLREPSPGHPYHEEEFAGARGSFAASLAKELARPQLGPDGERWGAFLVAGLYTHHFAGAAEPTDDNAAARAAGRRVPRTLPELLDLDLANRPGPWPGRVLATLAHARGEGMPAEILLDATVALTGGGPADRRRAAAALAGVRFYLRAAADRDGTTLYRLFHKGLVDHLRQREEPETAGRLAEALLAPLAEPEVRRWDLAEPYLLRHAAAHCLDAGRADLLAGDMEFLVHGEPGAVAAVLAEQPDRWLPPGDYLDLRQRAGGSRSALRIALALRAAQYDGGTGHARRLCRPLGWWPVWSRPRRWRHAPVSDAVLVPRPATHLCLSRERGDYYAVTALHDGEITGWRLDGHTWSPLWTARVPPGPRRISLAGYGRGRMVRAAGPGGFALGLQDGRPRDRADEAYPDVPIRSGVRLTPIQLGEQSWSFTDRGDEGVPAHEVTTESGARMLVADPVGGIRILRRDGDAWLPAGWHRTTGPVTALTGAADGPRLYLIYAVGREARIAVRNLRKDQPGPVREDRLGLLPGADRLTCVLSPRGVLILGAGEVVKAWRWTPDAPSAEPPVPSRATLFLHRPGRVAIGEEDGTVIVCEAATGTVVGSARPHTTAVTALGWGPAGTGLLASAAGRSVAVLDAGTGRIVHRGLVPEEDGAVDQVGLAALGDDLLLLTAGPDGGALTSLAHRTRQPLPGRPVAAPAGPVETVLDGRRLLAEPWGTGLRVTDPAADRLVAHIDLLQPVDRVLAGPDGGLLVRTGGRVVLLAPQSV